MEKILDTYAEAQWYWVQEEPENMGYWSYLVTRHMEIFKNFTLVARPIAASPATGFSSRHAKEQLEILTKSFAK